MLILGNMHNLEVYAIVIQKNDGAIFKINFDTILTGLNITHEMTNHPLDIFFRNRHITKTYACKVSYDKNSSGDEIANVLVNDDIAHT